MATPERTLQGEMQSPALHREVFRVGDYEIDPTFFEVRFRGRRQAVQPRVFDLMIHLIEHRHRVVSTNELRATVWRGLHVCTDSITYAVKAARRALGDDGKTQAVIVNVRGRGYRFVGFVAGVAARLGCPRCGFGGAG